MQNLQQLIVAGFNRGHDNSPGMDRTVSSLEWALANVGNSGTANCYADDAAGCLEARLIAAYVIQSMAHLKSGDRTTALQKYEQAISLQKLANRTSFGGSMSTQVDEALSELEHMFEQQRMAA